MKHETDEEIVRRIMSDPESTLSERELAYRMHRLIVSHDTMEDIMLGFKDVEGRVH